MALSVVISGLVSVLLSLATVFTAERKLRRDHKLDRMAENAACKLLEAEDWKMRSFEQIKARLGGFDDDELRRVLVRAGAVRFRDQDGKELWGLLKRNPTAL